MSNANIVKLVISGAPLIGEGNIVDVKSLLATLGKSGIPGISIYPNGPMVKLGRWFHIRMSMRTDITMDYAFNSGRKRSSIMVLPLKQELKRSIKKTYRYCPGAICFITSQSMMAEEFTGSINEIPSIMFSSDISGKLSRNGKLSERQRNIIHLVWNRESLDLYKHEFNLNNVHLTIPVDPKEAFNHIERAELPFQDALEDPDVCFIKLSGSGGDPVLINAAITSLWGKNRVRSIVFPGLVNTQKRLIKTVGSNVNINTSLDTGAYYNQAREMISGKHMLLTYPSEQVKHISILTSHNIFPKVVWLPPRGEHEVANLTWAIKHGFSGTVCIPSEYQSRLKSKLTDMGVRPSDVEFAVPEKLSAGHFRQSPLWKQEEDAVTLESIVRKVTSID